jgi:hypothetical protein
MPTRHRKVTHTWTPTQTLTAMASCPATLPKSRRPVFDLDTVGIGSSVRARGITADVLTATTYADAMAVYRPEVALQVAVNDAKLLCLAFDPDPKPLGMFTKSWMVGPAPRSRGHDGRYLLYCMGARQDDVTSAAAGPTKPDTYTLRFSTRDHKWLLRSTEGEGGRTQKFRSLQHILTEFLPPVLAGVPGRAFIPPIIAYEWVRHPKHGDKTPAEMRDRNEKLFAQLGATPSARLQLLPLPFQVTDVTHMALVRASTTVDAQTRTGTFLVLHHGPSETWALLDPAPTAAWARMSQCLDVLLGTLVLTLQTTLG